MKEATFTIVGISPYSQSRVLQSKRIELQDMQEFEEASWREHIHAVEESHRVFIPPMAIKNALSECAKFISMSVPGKGKATYTKHFEAGLLCTEPVLLETKIAGEWAPLLIENVKGERLFLPSDGRRGSGKRVWKIYPTIAPPWRGKASVFIMDDTITADIFETHLARAGQYIGIGRFRPRNNGFYGRFSAEGLAFSEVK